MKLSVFNKLFIVLFALLMMFIVWKVPHENNTSQKYQNESASR